MLNCATVMIVIMCASGYIVHFLEHQNMHLGTLSRGTYWGVMTFLQASENEPRRKKARVIMIIAMLANILAMNGAAPRPRRRAG